MSQYTSDQPLRDEIGTYQRLAGLAGVAGLGISILAALVLSGQRDAFLQSYLWAYAFWTGLALGCGAICMIHNLTGGRWGQAGKRIWLAGNGTMIVMALLSLPLLWGAMGHHVWIWADAERAKTLPVGYQLGPHKAIFFQFNWIVIRGMIYVAVWIATSLMLAMAQRRIEQTGSFAVRVFYGQLSAFALILFVLTLTFAVIDWIMSLEPYYYSTMYVLIYVTGEVLSAFCFAVVMISLLMKRKEFAGKVSIDQYGDLGTFTFAWVVLWGYTSLFQFLISWMGDLRNEMRWYAIRNVGFWHFLAVCLIVFQFSIPFLLLLHRPIKRNPCIMIWIAAGIMLMRLIDLYWLIKPAFQEGHSRVSWMDPFVLVGIGGIFVFTFLGRLKSGPLDPPPLLPGENPPTGHGHAAFSHVAAEAKAQGALHV